MLGADGNRRHRRCRHEYLAQRHRHGLTAARQSHFATYSIGACTIFTSACDHFTLNLLRHTFCAGSAGVRGSCSVHHPNSLSKAWPPRSDDAGFCPVISVPSVSTEGAQSGPVEYTPPLALSMSSTRNGTIWGSCTASSSVLVKPVTFLPFTRGDPSGALVLRNTPGAWHTSARGLPAAKGLLVSAMDCASSARSHRGPWPPG